jgi:hypothetical protein
MSVTTAVPDVWEPVHDETRFERHNAREYTRIVYEHESDGQAVRISDVQEPNSFVGWRYLVRATGETTERLGVVGDLETAKERAHAFMTTYEPNGD